VGGWQFDFLYIALVGDPNGMEATCQPTPFHTIHIDYGDMSFRKSLSKFQEKVKDKLKIGGKSERPGADVGGKKPYLSALSSQSEPGIVVEGEFRGGDIKTGAGKDDPRPGDSQSVSCRSAVGTGRDLGESDDNAYGGETDQSRLHPQSHLRPSISRGGEPEST